MISFFFSCSLLSSFSFSSVEDGLVDLCMYDMYYFFGFQVHQQ